MVERIVVALDNLDASRRIFEQAINLAKATHACLMLLHVLSPFEEGYPNMPGIPGIDAGYPIMLNSTIEDYRKRWEEFERAGLKRLQEWTQEAIALGIPTEFTQNIGDPGRMICAIARNWDADLIVMGRRGRSGFSEFVLGSTSNYVLHHACCSVFVVQGQSSPATVEAGHHVAAIQ